jgi:glutathionyl-hydroquinone reductase
MSQQKRQLPLYELVLSSECPHCHLVHIFWSLQKLSPLCSIAQVSHVDKKCTGPLLKLISTGEVFIKGSKEVLSYFIDQSKELICWRAEGASEWMSLMETLYQSIETAGHAVQQSIYDEAFVEVFEILSAVEQHLASSQYLAGDGLTQADWMLFVIMVRFDAVYYPLYKCNAYRLVDYQQLFRYMLELYQMPDVAVTVDFSAIKSYEYLSNPALNPRGLVPKGPVVNWLVDHQRYSEYF